MSEPRHFAGQMAPPRIVAHDLPSSCTIEGAYTSSVAAAISRPPSPAQIANDHARTVFANKFTSRAINHDKVCALLLSWDPPLDDLDVQPEVNKLHGVLEQSYGFRVEREYLKNSTKARYCISKFIDDHHAKNTLLILYYAGHGYCDKDGMFRIMGKVDASIFSDDVERRKNSIAWNGIEGLLKEIESDVLVIFDCCEAGSLAKPGGRGPPRRSFEFLAACSDEQVAARPGNHSFTKALIESLKKLREHNKPFTSYQLLKQIKNCGVLSNRQTPVLISRSGPYDDNVWIAPLNEPGIADQGDYQLDYDYLDVRLHCYKSLEDSDIEQTAEGLSQLVGCVLPGFHQFPVRNITLLKKSSHRKTITPVAKHWLSYKRRASEPPPPMSLAIESATASSTIRYEEQEYLSPGPAISPYPESVTSECESNAVTCVSEHTPLRPTNGIGVNHDRTPYGTLLSAKSGQIVDSDPKQGVRYHFAMLVQCMMVKLRLWFIGPPDRTKKSSPSPV